MRKLFIGMAIIIGVAVVVVAWAIDQSFTRTELPYQSYEIDGVFDGCDWLLRLDLASSRTRFPGG